MGTYHTSTHDYYLYFMYDVYPHQRSGGVAIAANRLKNVQIVGFTSEAVAMFLSQTSKGVLVCSYGS